MPACLAQGGHAKRVFLFEAFPKLQFLGKLPIFVFYSKQNGLFDPYIGIDSGPVKTRVAEIFVHGTVPTGLGTGSFQGGHHE